MYIVNNAKWDMNIILTKEQGFFALSQLSVCYVPVTSQNITNLFNNWLNSAYKAKSIS